MKWTSEIIEDLILQKYGHPGAMSERYAIFFQVPMGTGYARSGWIDAAVFDLWPSGGLTRMALEIKVSRADFLKELKRPSKNSDARKFFHEFWYVTAPGVVKSESEIPEGCGWMLAQRTRLITKLAAKRKADPPLDEVLMAAVCRSAQNSVSSQIREVKRNLKENDRDYIKLRNLEKAVKKFMTTTNTDRWFSVDWGSKESNEDMIERLCNDLMKATLDKGQMRDRDRLLQALDTFQSNIRALFEHFAVLAYISLVERDKAGAAIVELYGGVDQEALANHRIKAASKNKGQPGSFEFERKNADFLDTLETVMKPILDARKREKINETPK